MASATSLLPIETPARDPVVGWGLALAFESVAPAAGAIFGADILRGYVLWLGLLGLVLGITGCLATCFEHRRRRAGAAERSIATAPFVE